MPQSQRRLAAIVAMDVVGYSRLMGEDERGTLETLKDHRATIDPIGAEHGGRIVGTAGDGVLVEFPSVVEAVNFALRAQAAMAERNQNIPDDKQMLFRIGINLGDVLADGDDIFGDGVNVAARLESLAEPGGICVSRTVRDNIRDKMDVEFEDLGEIEVKNITRPIRTFRVTATPQMVSAIEPSQDSIRGSSTSTLPSPRWKLITGIAAALIIAICAAGYWWWTKPDFAPADPDKYAYELPDKPSIAVLPFNNMSDDPEQEYFVDGMTEDLITDLSKISSLFVVARNSVFTYKGKTIKVQQVAEELGVRYVLEGSVRRSGDQVRINAQLIDVVTGGHIWADRFDGKLTDVFALQDKATAKVVAALAIQLKPNNSDGISQQGTSSVEAYDAYLKGWSHFRKRTPDDYAIAHKWLKKAVSIDQGFGQAWAALASLYLETQQRNWSTALGISIDQGNDQLSTALGYAFDNPTALAHRVKGEILSVRFERFEDGLIEVEKALALDPNDPENHILLAAIFGHLERFDEAIEAAETALRLDPHYPGFNLFILGIQYFGKKNYSRSIELLERARALNPDDHFHLPYLAAAYAHNGEIDRAESAVAELRKLYPDSYYGGPFAATQISWNISRPRISTISRDLESGLIKSGVPVLPIDAGVRPEDLIRGNDSDFNSLGFNVKGYCCGGGMWSVDIYKDGKTVSYWNGQQTGTGKRILHKDHSALCNYADPPSLINSNCCLRYRNKDGSKNTLDEYIGICSHGIFPFSQFKLE